MNMTKAREDRHPEETRSGFNRPLFEDRVSKLNLGGPTATARALGLHRPDLYRILDGQLPGLHKGIRIAKHLGVDPLALWPEAGE